MSGEINGTKVVIKKGETGSEAVIVGQGDFTFTFGGEPIDISNKSGNDFVQLLDGELSGKQIVASGPLVYNNDVAYEDMRSDALAGTMDKYTIEYGTTGESFYGDFIPHGMSDSAPMGARLETSITISSSGSWTHTAAT